MTGGSRHTEVKSRDQRRVNMRGRLIDTVNKKGKDFIKTLILKGNLNRFKLIIIKVILDIIKRPVILYIEGYLNTLRGGKII